MPVIKKKSTTKGYGETIVDSNMKSYANDPFVLKKVAEAKEFFRKNPLPDHLKK
jgi:hypothetical protein